MKSSLLGDTCWNQTSLNLLGCPALGGRLTFLTHVSSEREPPREVCWAQTVDDTSRFHPGDLITVGESHRWLRGAFVSTVYPGSSTGIRVKEGLAFVIQVLDRNFRGPMLHPHYLIMTFHEGVKLGWILGTGSWRRVD